MLFLAACSPTRRLAEGESLLIKTRIVELDKPEGYSDKVYNYIQEKTNKKRFGFWRFNLQIYNLPNPEKLVVKKNKQVNRRLEKYEKYVDRIEARNTKWKEKGKKDKHGNIKHKKPKDFKNKLTFGEWLQSIGEPPALLDSSLIEKSREQIVLYAQNKGFFQAQVTDSVIVKNKKATVTYYLKRGPAYMIDSVFLVSEDTNQRFVKALEFNNLHPKTQPSGQLKTKDLTSANSLLYNGMQYDVERFRSERERIENQLKAYGYYLFSADYISFKADTSKPDHRMNLFVRVKPPNLTFKQGDSTIVYKHHLQFAINRVFIDPDARFQNKNIPFSDTVQYKGYDILYRGERNYKPRNIVKRVRIVPGRFYNPIHDTRTQSYVNELKNFSLVNILYTPLFKPGNDSIGYLNANIELRPFPRQSLGVEFQGTNTSGNLGIAVSGVYQNKNLFKGAEILEFRINAGAEIQVIQGDSIEIDRDFPFNTLEIGAQLSLITPRLLFPGLDRFVKNDMRVSSHVSLSFNYQNRPDYQRVIGSFAFGYDFQKRKAWRHVFNILEISLINIQKTDAFQEYIDETNDLFVINSFKPHFIENLSYTYTYNNYRSDLVKPYMYFRLNAQPGGNLMNLIALTGAFKQINGQYMVFNNVPYAQFIRADVDYRYYGVINKNNTIALRGVLGVGLPYGNSTVLPFEKSYFVGGSNDLRAWLPRNIGPGSYQQPEDGRIDQVGDIKFLGSIEYRARIYRFFETAIFADFGNIWLIRQDTNRTDGEFRFDRFYREIALGMGVGVRLNFDFFIFRLDVALPFHDPSKELGKRWVITDPDPKSIRFNIGIGYPF